MNQHWAVARVFSKRVQRIRAEAEEMDCGVSIPIYKRVRYVAGQPKKTDRQLLPGYLFVRVTPDDRARIVDLDGVYSLLQAGVRGAERLAAEMALMERRAMEGEFNDVEASPSKPQASEHRRRRPRRSKRAKSRPGPIVRAKMRMERERA